MGCLFGGNRTHSRKTNNCILLVLKGSPKTKRLLRVGDWDSLPTPMISGAWPSTPTRGLLKSLVVEGLENWAAHFGISR